MPENDSAFHDLSQVKSAARSVYFVMREAHARAMQERRAARDAAEHDPELEAVLAQFNAIGAANDDTPAAPRPLIKKSKTRTVRPRRSYARDRRKVKAIKGFIADARPTIRERCTAPLVDAPLLPSTPSVPPAFASLTPTAAPTRASTKREKADEGDTRKAPAWRYTTEIIRGHCAIRTVSTQGAGLSWTLNLGGKVLAAVNDNPKAALAQFQDRLAKALKAEFGEARDFLFYVETTTAGRPHLHGAVDGNMNEADRIEAVLVRCGGTWEKARREHQAHVADLWLADGWVRYSAKDAAKTKRVLGLAHVLFMTRGCRMRAEALWEDTRKRA